MALHSYQSRLTIALLLLILMMLMLFWQRRTVRDGRLAFALSFLSISPTRPQFTHLIPPLLGPWQSTTRHAAACLRHTSPVACAPQRLEGEPRRTLQRRNSFWKAVHLPSTLLRPPFNHPVVYRIVQCRIVGVSRIEHRMFCVM